MAPRKFDSHILLPPLPQVSLILLAIRCMDILILLGGLYDTNYYIYSTAHVQKQYQQEFIICTHYELLISVITLKALVHLCSNVMKNYLPPTWESQFTCDHGASHDHDLITSQQGFHKLFVHCAVADLEILGEDFQFRSGHQYKRGNWKQWKWKPVMENGNTQILMYM